MKSKIKSQFLSIYISYNDQIINEQLADEYNNLDQNLHFI